MTGVNLEIAPYFRASDWRKLNLNDPATLTADWDTAISVFESRIKARFLDAIEALIEVEKEKIPKRFGFAILAIDCLLIETLQAFYEGEIAQHGKSRKLFTNFLKRWKPFIDAVPPHDQTTKADLFYKDVRCALHHSGATGAGCRVGIFGDPITINGNAIEINRTELHAELEEAFLQYIAELWDPANSSLRDKFKIKMDAICT